MRNHFTQALYMITVFEGFMVISGAISGNVVLNEALATAAERLEAEARWRRQRWRQWKRRLRALPPGCLRCRQVAWGLGGICPSLRCSGARARRSSRGA